MMAVTARRTPVLGSWMAHREVGHGRPVLLLHGNPTSSYLWRHVLAAAASRDTEHRWIAVDLIGMGDSGKPAIAYRLLDHLAHVDALIEALELDDLVLVGHDWGVAIAMDLLRRRTAAVRGIAVMEGHLRPLPGWDAFDDGGRELFARLRTPGEGERMVLEEDFFLRTLLPAAVQRPLAAEDLDAYRSPYPRPEDRTPLLQWAREIPVADDPADVAALMAAASAHWTSARTPRLLLHGEPCVLTTDRTVEWARSTGSGLTIRSVGGPAGHFLPEDRPAEVSAALLEWVATLG
ncbi:haloalkane dehalogenase [Amnibacterium endophyticum]|uniref:Haloalkane dehalogenase n=1 Tax=Amnibacterium endophyticum TaxID=2109337 RepID=A0ABW4LAU9_9MICO